MLGMCRISLQSVVGGALGREDYVPVSGGRAVVNPDLHGIEGFDFLRESLNRALELRCGHSGDGLRSLKPEHYDMLNHVLFLFLHRFGIQFLAGLGDIVVVLGEFVDYAVGGKLDYAVAHGLYELVVVRGHEYHALEGLQRIVESLD